MRLEVWAGAPTHGSLGLDVDVNKVARGQYRVTQRARRLKMATQLSCGQLVASSRWSAPFTNSCVWPGHTHMCHRGAGRLSMDMSLSSCWNTWHHFQSFAHLP